ncbi:uncharacterized protein [Nicotiana tomentosiformis]|uniref:uncharacterized protein n=1 Tax=Nicotiana tomentosiformis TaxID=4098 RepID=UPI00388CECFD
MCNAIVLSWLMNTVSTELLSGIVYASNTHLVWEDLRERFDKVNCMRIFQIHRAIATLSQGTNFVSTYFTKLKGLWKEYDDIVPASNSREYAEHLQQQMLLQFLSGLNDSYDQVRRQFLLQSNEPSLNQAYAMVIEDESQHSSSGLNEKIDPMAMQVGRGQGYRGKKPFIQCEHCGLRGHTKKNYYKIIGYPEDFKGKKKFNNSNFGGQPRRGNGNFRGQFGNQQSINAVNNVCGNAASAEVQSQSSSTSDDLHTTLAGKGPNFTEDQYKRILGMLSKDSVDAQANIAGATHHITATENLLKDEAHTRKASKDSVHRPTEDKDLSSGRVKGIVKGNAGLYILREAIGKNKVEN